MLDVWGTDAAGTQYDMEVQLGSLMADFCESDPDRIRDDMVRDRVQYLKRDPEGVREMCRISEEIFNEGVQKGVEKGARDNLLKNVRSMVKNLQITAPSQLPRAS